MVDWQGDRTKAKIAIDQSLEYPKDDAEFSGLYGYQVAFATCGFISSSNRYFLLTARFKGQNRLFVVDLDNSGKVRWVNFLQKAKDQQRDGEYDLMTLHDDVAIISYSQCNAPARVYALFFKNLEEGLDEIKFEKVLLAENKINSLELAEAIQSIKKDFIKLENGAEGYFLRLSSNNLTNSSGVGTNGKHPMLTFIHGGPFMCLPQDSFTLDTLFLILQGYCVLIVNYRGTVGFGKRFMDSLLGKVGSIDVEDCANLTIKATE